MNNEKFNKLKVKVTHGIFVLMLRDFGLKIISIIGQIVLVRLVAPEYFGFFAIITFLVGAAELFTDLGLTQAIIREKKKLTNIQINTILSIKLLLSVVTMVLLLLSYPIISSIYKQLSDDNFLMLVVLSSTLLAKAIKGVSIALIDRELDFGLVARVDFIGAISFFCVAIILALNNLMLWNFILALFVKEYLELLVVLYYKPFKLSRKFSFKSIRYLIKYGSFIQLGNFVNFIDSSIIPIAGSKLSANQLGLLNWSFNITTLSNALFDNYGRAAFAGMSKIQTMKDKLSLFINKSISLLNIVSFLIIALVIGYSREFTILFLTDKWLPALPSLYWFIASLLFYGGAVTLAHALLAIGKSKEIALLSAFLVLLEIAFAIFSQRYFGFTGIAISVFLTYFALFASYVFIATRNKLQVDLYKALVKKLYLLFFIMLIVSFFNFILPLESFLSLLAKVSVTILIYILLLYLTAKEELREVYSIIFLLKSKK